MAPVTRSSLHSGRPSESQTSPEPSSSDQSVEDFNSGSQDDGDEDNDDRAEEEYSEDGEEEMNRLQNPSYLSGTDFYSTTAKDILQPLQQTADRVSRQVEEFAKCLDKFNATRDANGQKLWEEAWGVLDKYAAIALNRKERLASGGARSRSSSRNRRSSGDPDAEAQKSQFEADLWTLAKDLLVCNCPKSHEDAQTSQKERLQELHRYSTNSEIWEAFLDSDVTAQECETTLAWLQDRAATNSPRIEDVIADLTVSSQRGETWSAGPIYTKNAIKAQKRSRVWSKPLEPTYPGIRSTHVRTLDNLPLVTQLDPDAPARENSVLQSQDDFHEQAAWKACWEFLRRGSFPVNIQQYWSERKENWRAMSLQLGDPFAPQHPTRLWCRIVNLASNAEWVDRCKELCQEDSGLYPYETAVYGLMCGDLNSSLKVCHTIDDTLFAMFNSMLIFRYKAFLEAYREKVSTAVSAAYQPPAEDFVPIRQYLTRSLNDEKTRNEMEKPHKLLEGAIICMNFDNFLVQQGKAISQVIPHTVHPGRPPPKDDSPPAPTAALIAARDPDSVRIIAHLQLLLKSLGYLSTAYKTHLNDMENNIVAYIIELHRRGEIELVPLYASKLSEWRVQFTMGPILLQITVPRDRELQIRLMKRYEINIPDVLWGMWRVHNHNINKAYEIGLWKSVQGAKIIEYVGPNQVKNIKVRADFMTQEISEATEWAIRSAEWFRYIDPEQWGRACYCVSVLYIAFLMQGKLDAARHLVRRASLTDLSLAALGMNLHMTIAEESPEEGDLDMDGVARAKSPSPTAQLPFGLFDETGTDRKLQAKKASVWIQLEQLVIVMDYLEQWAYLVNQADNARTNAVAMRTAKKDLTACLASLREHMAALLEPDFLCTPLTDTEAGALTVIRNHYLPECVLAYNSVLFFAGHSISRSWLVECMNLAQVVAGTESLTRAFVEGKRMRELMDALAKSAQGMIGASEVKKGRGSSGSGAGKEKERGGREGGLGLWSVRWPSAGRSDGVGDLEALD